MVSALGYVGLALLSGTGLFGAVVLYLYVSQERFIFPAPAVDVSTVAIEQFAPVKIPTPDNETLYALHHPAQAGEPTIIVFHGNGDAAVWQEAKGLALAEAGFGALLVSYRGYPGSSGQPGEVGLVTDGLAAYDFVARSGVGPVGLWGHSLGTGIAIQVGAQRRSFAAVLDAPFESILALAQRRYPWAPVAPLLRHPFRSDLVVGNMSGEILMTHGSDDQIVPIDHGRRLHALAPPHARFVEIDNAGHIDLREHGAIERGVAFLAQAFARHRAAVE